MQSVFDLLLGQDEETDGDEEARPRAEVEQKGVRIRRPERAPGDKAQDKRNAPGEGDEYRGPSAGKQSVLPKHPEAPLQFEERPAMRRQIFPDAACFVLVDVNADRRVNAPGDARHVRSVSQFGFVAASSHRRRLRLAVMDGELP